MTAELAVRKNRFLGDPRRLKLTRVTPSEHAEQCAVIDFWRYYSASKGIDERLLFAVPNGSWLQGDAKHRAMQSAKLKAEGFRPGVPDLMLAMPKIAPDGAVLFHGLFLELKRKGGRAEPHQIEYCDLLRRQGYNVVIAQGADECIRAIKAYIET